MAVQSRSLALITRWANCDDNKPLPFMTLPHNIPEVTYVPAAKRKPSAVIPWLKMDTHSLLVALTWIKCRSFPKERNSAADFSWWVNRAAFNFICADLLSLSTVVYYFPSVRYGCLVVGLLLGYFSYFSNLKNWTVLQFFQSLFPLLQKVTR